MHYFLIDISRPGQNLEEKLAPFSDNLEVEPYIDMTREDIINFIREHDAKSMETLRKAREDEEAACDWYVDFIGARHLVPEDSPEFTMFAEIEFLRGQEAPTDEMIATAEKIIEMTDDEAAYRRCRAYDDAGAEDWDEDGNLLTTWNPDGQWDWYVIGGRWDGALRLKRNAGGSADETSDNKTRGCESSGNGSGTGSGEPDKNTCSGTDGERVELRANIAAIRNIDLSPDEQTYMEALDEWENLSEPIRKLYADASDYAQACATFSSACVLDADGVWHESPNCWEPEWKNWRETFVERFLADAPDDYIVTVVDIHR